MQCHPSILLLARSQEPDLYWQTREVRCVGHAVYKVKVGKFPQCNCPDFKIRKNLCKHYLYVMIRVLRLREDDPLVWQRALLLSEVEEVSASPICSRAPSLHASRPSSSAYIFLERY